MAGMFYSLKETAERLGITEDQVRQLAKDGKIREFRDGSNLLFKIEEVNALIAEGIDITAEDLELQGAPAEEELAEAVDDESALASGESLEDDIFKLGEEETPALEPVEEGEATSELGLAPELESQEEASEKIPEEELFLTEEEQPAVEEAEQPIAEELEPVAETPEATDEEISLAAESGVLASDSDITSMDTALTGEGVNVLSETDSDYKATEDSMAETAVPAGSAETGAEASLEEIEDDVNLDSFGSGSGLLDLSLQADDTSLGGILDEIYTAEGGEGEAAPAGEAEAGSGEAASFDEITAEAEHGAHDEEMTVPEPVAVMPTAMTPVYAAEAIPDAQSNILGILLFLPLLALLYTAIVTVAALKEVMPSILASVQSLVWYIMGGAVVLALIMVGASFMAGREKAPKAAKPAKEKAKAEKPRKEKAAKAEKPAEKPAKEKKSFFGKKKGKK